jgi:4-phospho-D-threonate 3-dehydrogenase / 4-phospho-D-erythronate 3-dehydrogenase
MATELRKLPLIAITMGDPSSIGPEITLKALSDPSLAGKCRPLVIGDITVLREALGFAGMPRLALHAVRDAGQARFEGGTVDVLDMGIVGASELEWGKVSPLAGDAAFHYVTKAIELAMAREVDAMVTNALNKEAMNLAGHRYSGHTEILAEYTHTQRYSMMLALGDLRVVHVSTHVSLREACNRVKRARVLEAITLAADACAGLGIASPRIGVAGLNPHCGENGLFGREEMEEIAPAIADARASGIDALGPVPADTIFSKALGGWYDIVVAMYHDQGHIPMKTLGFSFDRETGLWESVEGVNVTLGLPIIRSSVDHGTAFDQAGLGTANPLSLRNAIDYACCFALGRRGPTQA